MTISEKNINLHMYTGNKLLLPFVKNIQTIFSDVIETIDAVLPLSDVDIDVYAGNLQHAPESGIIGHTEYGGTLCQDTNLRISLRLRLSCSVSLHNRLQPVFCSEAIDVNNPCCNG